MNNLLSQYSKSYSQQSVEASVKDILANHILAFNAENLKKAFSLIDLTTLNTTDTNARALQFCKNVNQLEHNYSFMPSVAAICVFPSLVEAVKKNLTKKGVKIASVTAGFPSSQTFISIKTAESSMAVDKGADEVDIVISVGSFLENDYMTVFNEISLIKESIGNAHLKVILETGALKDLNIIKNASIIAIAAGADFIKTSTGKLNPPATLEAVFVMTEIIKDYYNVTDKKIGIKPAGGIVTAQDAINYLSIVRFNLGDEWLTPELFRIGASKLANNLIEEIIFLEKGIKESVNYF